MSASDLNAMRDQIETIPDARPEDWAVVTRLLVDQAPDLLPMLGVTA